MNRFLLCYLLFLLTSVAQLRPEIPYTAARKLQLTGGAFGEKGNNPGIKVKSEESATKPKIKEHRMDESISGPTPSFLYKPECQRNVNNKNCKNNNEETSGYQFASESLAEEVNPDLQLPHCPDETDRLELCILF